MNLLVISTSLNPESKSATLAGYIYKNLKRTANNIQFLDTRILGLPICAGSSSMDNPSVQKLQAAISEADGVLMGCPIYNYNVGATAKNILELGGRLAWRNKVVGLLFTAGGERSFASVIPFIGSLLLDFQTIIIPKYVYSTQGICEDNNENSDIADRLDTLTRDLIKYTRAFHNINEQS